MTEISDLYEERELLTYKGGRKNKVRQHIVKEMQLTVVLNGESVASLSCSPHAQKQLAVGFLVSKGILSNRDQLERVSYQPDQEVLQIDMRGDPSPVNGFPGDGIANDHENGLPAMNAMTDSGQMLPVDYSATFSVQELLDYVALLNEKSATFRLTGGVHEAALAHSGDFVVWYEDIGRHNALDRVLGFTFLNEIDTSDKAVVLSGRIVSEMLIKSAWLRVPLVVSRSAPTCRSIDLAEQLGMTLVGFARGDSLNVYTHPDRIIE